jgi:PadR family transcriptional regulator, regulatory protein PadR
MSNKNDVLQGTLDLMVLKTLQNLGEMHGYGVARRIEQVSEVILRLNQGTLYPALVRLEQRRWIRSKWGLSETGRRARFYSLTAAGRRQIEAEEEKWRRTAAVMGRFIEAQ